MASRQKNDEFAKAVKDSEEISLMVKGDGWKIARSHLINAVAQCSDITEIAKIDKPIDVIVAELKARAIAKDIILSWISVIEGEAESHKALAEMLRSEQTSVYINNG